MVTKKKNVLLGGTQNRSFKAHMIKDQPRPYRVRFSYILVDDKCKLLDYSRVEYDKRGFADASRFLPIEFELCNLKTTIGTIVPGWWDGVSFYSHKIKNRDLKVVAWEKTFTCH